MSGSFWFIWVGARSGRWVEHGNATKSRFATGRRRCGRPLKKSASGRAHPGLHRRKRTEPATASLSHLGAPRPDTRPAIQLQLEESFGSCRADAVELLLSNLYGCDQEGAGRGFSGGLGASPSSTVADRVGSSASTPQSAGAGLPCRSAGLDLHHLSAPLRARTQSGRVHLGLLEAARVTECLPEGLLATDRNGATNATSHAPPSPSDLRLLATSFFVVTMTLYYAGLNKDTRDKNLHLKAEIAPSPDRDNDSGRPG